VSAVVVESKVELHAKTHFLSRAGTPPAESRVASKAPSEVLTQLSHPPFSSREIFLSLLDIAK
jgi:hypothetical protein